MFEEITVKLLSGMLQVLPHKLRHQGLPPKNGTNYMLSSDVLYGDIQNISPFQLSVRSVLQERLIIKVLR